MNFYKHVRDQRLYNWSIIINYAAGYIYFMKTLEEGKENNTWLERYIDLTQINQKLANDVVSKDFNLIEMDHDH